MRPPIGGTVMEIDRTMLRRAFGFVAARAAAAVGGGVAVDLLEQGVAAVGDAALHDTEGAAFADFGAGLPLGVDAEGADLAEAGGGEFADRFEEVAGNARCGR
jgi:hypothetical protein